MYHHVKKLMFTVRVDEPDPRFGNMLLEQFGGANGELAAALQYSIQGLNCEDPDRKDLLMDIGTEELRQKGAFNCYPAWSGRHERRRACSCATAAGTSSRFAPARCSSAGRAAAQTARTRPAPCTRATGR